MGAPLKDNSPLLSVCIPTYNRAEWLRASLTAWLPQIVAAGKDVELIVSDNCSGDDTAAVVASVRPFAPIRYHRNETNIGANPNMYRLVSELARGEYVWVLGDDDIPRSDGLSRVLKALREHPDVDYFYVNYTGWMPPTRDAVLRSAEDAPNLSPTGSPVLDDASVTALRDLAGEDENCFTPVYCSIFRRPHACAAFKESIVDEPFSTIHSVISHAVYVAENLLDKRAYRIGYPCIIAAAEVSWSSYRPIYMLKHVPDLYDILERHGVSRRVLDVHRRKLLTGSTDPLYQMLTCPATPRRAQFSFAQFIVRHGRFPEFWRLLRRISQRTRFGLFLARSRSAVSLPLRVVRRLRRGLTELRTQER